CVRVRTVNWYFDLW
nr:immunoglobulin heavy chain junction region [Macaca mulatta]